MTKFKPGDYVEVVSEKHKFHVILKLLNYSTNKYDSFYTKIVYCPRELDYEHVNISTDMLYSKGYFNDHSVKKLTKTEFWDILYG